MVRLAREGLLRIRMATAVASWRVVLGTVTGNYPHAYCSLLLQGSRLLVWPPAAMWEQCCRHVQVVQGGPPAEPLARQLVVSGSSSQGPSAATRESTRKSG